MKAELEPLSVVDVRRKQLPELRLLLLSELDATNGKLNRLPTSASRCLKSAQPPDS
jgi:hypothetical protein